MLFGASFWLYPFLASAVDDFGAAPGEPYASRSSLTDSRLEVLAQKALLGDPTLSGFNIGVAVHNNVATIWGVVPSAALARRAADRLRQVPGIDDLKCDLRVLAAEAKQAPKTAAAESIRPIPALPGYPQESPRSSSNVASRPPVPDPGARPAAWQPQETSRAKNPALPSLFLGQKAPSASPGAILLAPVPVPSMTVGAGHR
jgi:hypothetical protein